MTELQIVAEIASVLISHGPVYSGGDQRTAEMIAADWLDYGFDAETTDEWCSAGCWTASVAESLRDAGLSPEQAATAVERCRESDTSVFSEDGLNYGCPMYAACQGSYDVGNIVAAHKLDSEEYVIVASDDEYNADEWWRNARERYPEISKALARDERVIVSGDAYEDLANLPGFADGPEHAKTALRRVGNWFDTVRSKRFVFIFATPY
jgi:hypothetical protein